MRARWSSHILPCATLLAAACGAQPPHPSGGPFSTPSDAGTMPSTSALCSPARSSEPLVPRVDLTGMGASSVGGQDVAYTSDLFGRFYSLCGGCHVDGALGNRQIGKSVDAFVAGFDASWLVPVMSNDPLKWMPRPGKAWAERAAKDPVVDFVTYASAWLSAGKPRNVFAVDDAGATDPGSAAANYTFTQTVASAMTNIGNCVPSSTLFASSTSGIMSSLDERFAGASELPATLAETDLTSFDSEELAKTAVIAYAPTYALWSAGSGKLRHIRVPRGKSVTFDKATQSFDIPDNTRFYKTFLRAVRDRTGETRWRKMETRVIVARADTTDPATGDARQNALFGTYVWSEDETTASLATQPYRDQTPWADIVRTYVTDELLYQNILDTTTGSVDGAVALAIRQNKNNPAYRDLLQHYAIPGRLRCIQCHMGSPTKDFVLGFIPLQVARRATGTGGTYDATGADELNQLQRLVDVGVVTGVTAAADVKPLEESQGARKPRRTAAADGAVMTTDGELTAQAYMLGNCAHCHNPRGFPSVSKPELATLNFLPDDEDGGVFEFALDRMSPLRKRGAASDIPIPYITPSLRDYPTAAAGGLVRIDNGKSLVSGETGALTYTPKFIPGYVHGDSSSQTCSDRSADPDLRAYCGDRTTGPPIVSAPWRSLIYRNVDTPASYFDDFVPFPRMPMHTAGFDCRAPRIMGDWMVGLPSMRKLVHLASLVPGTTAPSEDALPLTATRGRAPVLGALNNGDKDNPPYDDNPQPYMEVRPDSDLYEKALDEARARLVDYHNSVRYQYCQDVISPDIYDPFVPEHKEYPYHPNPHQYQLTYLESPPRDPMHPDRFIQPRIGVPLHAHWIDYDPTDPPPPWVPRRTEWEDILVRGRPDTAVAVGDKPLDELAKEPYGQEKVDAFMRGRAALVRALNEAELTQKLVDYATTEVPFGLWTVKPGCEQRLAASQKKVSDLKAEEKPAWVTKTKAAGDAPVFMMSPGAAIYRHVCFNCHGPNADGRGLQVDLLAAASEGEARPANFRDGLFGPPGQPLANIASAFDVSRSGDMSGAMLWGSRYMAWMALGGTLKRIPQDIIQLVASTPTLGVLRPNLSEIPGASDPTGNMLNLAKGLCAYVLPAMTDKGIEDYVAKWTLFSHFPSEQYYPPYNGGPFIEANYDKQMWLRFCSDFSPQAVRVYGRAAAGVETVQLLSIYYARDPADPTNPARSYPDNADIWDHERRAQQGVRSDNLYPACLHPTGRTSDDVMPACDAGFLANGKLLWKPTADAAESVQYAANVEVWKLRGAISAGMAVFSYLRHRVTHPELARLPPYYNQCDQLR
jgi:mono/diheme cytochrome c family protein